MFDVNDKYRLLLRLGRGGMAEVHVAVARGPAGWSKLVVVKRLLPAMADDEGFREMFMQEARLAARLNHPNIVQTYEVGDAPDGMFLAMEYLEGQPLSRLVRTLGATEKKLAVCTCIRIATELLGGLHHAHELKDFDGAPLKVVHRDVSPQNVFVTYLGQVKILDFGIAKAERSSTKTQPGWLKGKYAYMAPEQFLNGEIDRRVDVFTTATVLWELIAGRQLFGGGTEAQTVKRLVSESIPRLSTVIPAIDPQLDAIVARGLEREPADRFASALEMREALEDVLGRIGSTEDLGRVVSGAFEETRLETEEQIARLLGDSARMSTVGIAVPSSGSLRAVAQAGATSGASGFSHAGVARTTATPIPSDDDAEASAAFTRGRLSLTGILAAGAALVLATIVIARTVSGPPPVRANDAAPPSTPAVAAPSVPAQASTSADPIARPSAQPIADTSATTRASATHHATAVAPPPAQTPRWSPPPAPPKPAVTQPATTAATTPSAPAAPPPTATPAPTQAGHDESGGGNTRRPAPATTAPEGRRFRTTL